MTEKEKHYFEMREDMAAGFKALGVKVEGHADRIRFLERKTV